MRYCKKAFTENFLAVINPAKKLMSVLEKEYFGAGILKESGDLGFESKILQNPKMVVELLREHSYSLDQLIKKFFLDCEFDYAAFQQLMENRLVEFERALKPHPPKWKTMHMYDGGLEGELKEFRRDEERNNVVWSEFRKLKGDCKLLIEKMSECDREFDQRVLLVKGITTNLSGKQAKLFNFLIECGIDMEVNDRKVMAELEYEFEPDDAVEDENYTRSIVSLKDVVKNLSSKTDFFIVEYQVKKKWLRMTDKHSKVE